MRYRAAFDPAQLTFANFDVRDGLQANEFNFGASYRTAEGELYFGGINGYNALAPSVPVASSGSVMADGSVDYQAGDSGLGQVASASAAAGL